VPRSKKKRKKGSAARKEQAADVLNLGRQGMPAKDSIRRVVNFVSPQNVRYKIIKTTETNAYDQDQKSGERDHRKP